MELITKHICMTKDIGVHGNLFGGNMLSWLDEAGAMLAAQAADSNSMVTLLISEIKFNKPVRTGDLIFIYGEIKKIGTTSVTLNLEARRHNVVSGKQKVVCTTSMVFVNIDSSGEPNPISSTARKRFEENE